MPNIIRLNIAEVLMKAAKTVDQSHSSDAKVLLKNPVPIYETTAVTKSDIQNKINEPIPMAVKRQRDCKDVCQSSSL